MQPIILALTSPRRSEILQAMGLPFTIQPSAVDESRISADHPRTFALRAAFAKATDIANQMDEDLDAWVLGADTVVAKELILFGKPRDIAEAARMLRALSGAAHDVYTAVAIVKAGGKPSYLQSERTRVVFRTLSEDEIQGYIHGGEPMDKAGAYGIQGQGGALIDHIEGDYFNVVGLPCGALSSVLNEAGLEFPHAIPEPPDRWRDKEPRGAGRNGLRHFPRL